MCCVQDVEKMEVSLAAEQKKNKDLASQIVRLNGIIKTGHDALTQEQNLVKKLQDQMSNGTSSQVHGRFISYHRHPLNPLWGIGHQPLCATLAGPEP